MDFTTLLEYAETDAQRRTIEAAIEHGSGGKAAEALGLNKSCVNRTIQRVRERAARLGHAPGHFDSGAAPGYLLGKVTVQRGADGSVERTWERQSPEHARQREAMDAAIEAMRQELPRVSAVKGPTNTDNDLCNLYTITDGHIGALCWSKEGGDDWDLSIAEKTLVDAFAHMIKAAPPAKTAVVNQLGDFLHADSIVPMTPQSGHILDTDGRFSKAVGTAIRVLRRIIDMSLEHHDKVHVIIATGNHDISSSIWLRLMFSALYEKEPRITVNDSELPFYAYQHGSTMLAFHHGHTKKNDSLPLMFATQYATMWGECAYRYAHTGHRHHSEEKEHSGMKVVQHSTLAARDAYAARGGWHNNRQALAITYHSTYGEVARQTVTPGML